MGMVELETYSVVNDPFEGRYFRDMASMANHGRSVPQINP